MSFALWMILVAIFLPIVATGIAKAGDKNFDNNEPRKWQAQLTGYRARAFWAHQNQFEALPGFAAAVLVATFTHAPTVWTDVIAGLWVLFRIGYIACYITDRATLRSVMFMGGFFAVVALFVISA
jgi:uncharacterized MAPEG superfamily protein